MTSHGLQAGYGKGEGEGSGGGTEAMGPDAPKTFNFFFFFFFFFFCVYSSYSNAATGHEGLYDGRWQGVKVEKRLPVR